jgi:hypothetical protein
MKKLAPNAQKKKWIRLSALIGLDGIILFPAVASLWRITEPAQIPRRSGKRSFDPCG